MSLTPWLSSLVDIAPAIDSPEWAVARAIAAIAVTALRSAAAAIAKKCPDGEY